MKVLFLANTDWCFFNYRRPLIRALTSSGMRATLVGPSGPYVSKLREQGFRYVEISINHHGLNPFFYLGALFKVIRIYQNEKPDLVHHFTIKGIFLGVLAVRMTGIKKAIYSFEGMGHLFISENWTTKIARWFVSLFFRFFLDFPGARIVVMNRDDKAMVLAKKWVCAERLYLIPGTGVDCGIVPQASKPHRKENKIVRILFAGRLLREKGIFEFVEAAKIIKSKQYAAEFCVAGIPDPGNPSSVSAEQLNLWRREGNVIFLGHIDDLKNKISEYDLVVLPSCREGLPTILIEAGLFGIPAIASDVVGCRDVIIHDKNGLLVPPQNVDALVATIEELIVNEEKRKLMGQEAQRIVPENFDEKKIIKETLDIYRELLPGLSLPLFASKGISNC